MFSYDTFWFVVVASTVVDAIAASMVLIGRHVPHETPSPRIIGIGRLFTAASITATVFVLKLVPMMVLVGVRTFGIIHLLYADLVVLVPLLGIALLVGSRISVGGKRWRVLTTPACITALASLGAIPVGVYATWIEPFRLQLETSRVTVSPRRDGSHVLRIAVLSDLQTVRVTEYERNAVARLMAQRPDIILLPGDVFQGPPKAFEANGPALRELLAQLDAPGGVFLVLGDVDRGGVLLRELLGSTKVRLLVNETVRFEVGDRRVTIAGVDLDFTTGPARSAVDRMETGSGEGDIRILLAHRPDVVLGLRPNSRIDLVVAGHTHGGQVVVPWFGPPMTLSNVPRTVAAGGLHSLKDNPIYVSRGVGCERGQAPRIRFLCPPEITLLELGSSGGGSTGIPRAGVTPFSMGKEPDTAFTWIALWIPHTGPRDCYNIAPHRHMGLSLRRDRSPRLTEP